MNTFYTAFKSHLMSLSQVLGRNVRDFINELDNLHEYFRFSFPKVQPPSFCVEEECETSLTLHYRSTRKGFTQFVKGNSATVSVERILYSDQQHDCKCDIDFKQFNKQQINTFSHSIVTSLKKEFK